MLASFCYDPLEKPCTGAPFFRIEDGDLPAVPAGSLVSWPAGRPLPELLEGVDLEVRSQGCRTFERREKPWSLFLDCLDPFDLGDVEEILEAAATAGCDWVVAAPVRAAHLRYRLYSLVRLLCDRFKMKFTIFEDQELEAADRLNHYLANRRGCCRFRSLSGQRS
ncbi:MAG: hypothetical protein KF760_10925 [Candidatus Eremiobacteraeota bacterium]|nr:hypothetical protein [Candidatus Eremiobacteraeota bacterium]MCW5867245.1 hypothetical protein [Candidatus Eremiobacteraeota bacterium]